MPIAWALSQLFTACAEAPPSAVPVGVGSNPTLPAPEHSLLPTIHIAPAVGWASGAKPTAAAGLAVNAFASGLQHPRWVYVLPDGDVLVAETNAPDKPDDAKGVKGFVMKQLQKEAGATPSSANRITLLRDTNGTGVADLRTTFVEGLNAPFGMLLIGNDFYVADSDAVLKFSYTPGATHLTGTPTEVVTLPAGTINHHWTKNLVGSKDGSRLYVSVGSNSNAGENGIAAEAERAAIWEVDLKTGQHRLYATGIRNPNGLAWESKTGALWTVANERDELGNDLVPDYLTSVKDGAFYGWPYSYFGQHVDDRVKPQRPDLVASAIAPDYALGSHVAPLGLAFADGERLGAAYASGAFIGEHGSWNRNPRSGYKVVFVPFADGKPAGLPVDVLSGFLDEQGHAQGRPVGVALDSRGALLVADDVGNTVWRVSGSGGRP